MQNASKGLKLRKRVLKFKAVQSSVKHCMVKICLAEICEFFPQQVYVTPVLKLRRNIPCMAIGPNVCHSCTCAGNFRGGTTSEATAMHMIEKGGDRSEVSHSHVRLRLQLTQIILLTL